MPNKKLPTQASLCQWCNKPPHKRIVRGVCESCRHQGKELVKAGLKTDQELIDEGFWLPKGKPGPRSRSADAVKKLLSASK